MVLDCAASGLPAKHKKKRRYFVALEAWRQQSPGKAEAAGRLV